MANTKSVKNYTYNEILIKYLAKVQNMSESDFEPGSGGELAPDPADGFVGIIVYDVKNNIRYNGHLNSKDSLGITNFGINYPVNIDKEAEAKWYWLRSKEVQALNKKLEQLGSIFSYDFDN